jgi:tetratricopeptide (TPR) repeat protein
MVRTFELRLLIVLQGLLLTSTPVAADQAELFVAGLRARGWHDVVLDYLANASEDPLAKPDFLDRVDYERAVSLAALARGSTQESERLDFSRRASELFQSFAASHPDEVLYFDAMSKAAGLMAEQSLGKLARADRLPAGADGERTSLREEARAGLASAGKVVEQLLAACEKKIESLPKGAMSRKDPAPPITRQQLEAKQAEALLLGANLLFEEAKSYDASSDQFNEKIDAAAKAFSNLYRVYSDKLVGFYGRLLEGRCHQMAGNLEKALDCFADLVDQPISNADFRRLVARAHRRRAECHMAAENLDGVIEECRKWLRDSRGNELKQPEWLAVAFRLAEAFQQKAATAPAKDATRLQAEARQLLLEVSKQPGEFQVTARTTLAAGNAAAGTPLEVSGFDDAYVAGKGAWEQMRSLRLAGRLAAENNPDAVADLEQQAKYHQAEALRLFQAALRLIEDDSNPDDVLTARYYLCWIYWENGLLPEAAVAGEFLAGRYSESKYAKGAARVALAAHEKLYAEAKGAGEDGSYEAAKLAALAELVAKLWPASSEAGNAVNQLIQIALADNRLEEAEQLLELLPEASRAPAQLSLGSALWIRYLRQTAASSGKTDKAATLLRERADQILSDGYGGLPQGAPSAQVATGVLYYVQLLLAKDDSQRAVEVLENSSVGPLSVVKKGRIQAAFVQEAYKAALRAYLSIKPPQRDKAREMMNALEETFQDGGDPRKLTCIYVNLGRQLERQVSELTASGQAAQAKSVAAAFEDILQRITARGDSREWSIRNWIAQTNLKLGEGLGSEAAAPYLKEAEKLCREILADVEKDPKYAPKETDVLGVKKRLGDCLLAQKQYPGAFEQYVSILQEKSSLLDIQRSAALALQEWGLEQKLGEKLNESVRGSGPKVKNKNVVWGWLQIGKVASLLKQKAEAAAGDNQPDQQKIERYHNLFFEAYYQVAKTRLLGAQISTGAERNKQLNSARKNVESMKKLYPELGGPTWQQAFGELLKQIEAESSTD